MVSTQSAMRQLRLYVCHICRVCKCSYQVVLLSRPQSPSIPPSAPPQLQPVLTKAKSPLVSRPEPIILAQVLELGLDQVLASFLLVY